MKHSIRYLWLAPLFAAALLTVPACQTTPEATEDPSPHSSAALIPEVKTIRPGEGFTVGLLLQFDPGWHSYWLNPGDAGQPAAIEWRLPERYEAGEISWPYPQKIEEPSVVSYGYDDAVMLLTEITPPRSLTPGQTVTVAAQAHWLVCENICLPAMADLEVEIDVSDEEPALSLRWRNEFERARQMLPSAVEAWQMIAEPTDDGYDMQLRAAGLTSDSLNGAFFYINERGVLDHGAGQAIFDFAGGIRISLVRSPYAREDAERLEGVLVIPGDIDSENSTARAVFVDAPVTPSPNVN